MRSKVKGLRNFLRTLFSLSVDYENVPGHGIYAQGRLKFRFDEDALRRYFAEILPYVSLNELIGEAVFWFMLPSAIAIWTFPFLLYYSQGILFTVVGAVALYFIAEMAHLFFYLKPLNHILLIFGNHFLALIVYVIYAIILILSGSLMKAIILGAWFLFFALGLNELLSLIIFVVVGRVYFSQKKRFLTLLKPDQILINIGWYYASKLGIDPSKWEMYNQKTCANS